MQFRNEYFRTLMRYWGPDLASAVTASQHRAKASDTGLGFKPYVGYGPDGASAGVGASVRFNDQDVNRVAMALLGIQPNRVVFPSAPGPLDLRGPFKRIVPTENPSF